MIDPALHSPAGEEPHPIGIAGLSEAQDEYDAYVVEVYRLLSRRAGAQTIFDYLCWVGGARAHGVERGLAAYSRCRRAACSPRRYASHVATVR